MATGDDSHKVEAGSPGAHSHDHSHIRPAPARAGHIHLHVHLEDREADAKLNGHTHPIRPRRLPWEATE